MRLTGLVGEDGGKVGTGLEGIIPDLHAEDEGKDGAENDGVAVYFEEATIGGNGDGGDAQEESY